jgi:hypothetical protein
MNYVFWFLVVTGCSLLLTFLLRKLLFVLDATGRKPLFPRNRYCEMQISLNNKQGVVESIVKHLSDKHFSIQKNEDGYIFFSSVYSPYPIRIVLRRDAEDVRLALSDAHCQMTISRHQMDKYSTKIERAIEGIEKAGRSTGQTG